MQISFQPFGDKTLLISWPNAISETISREIFYFNRLVLKKHAASVAETVPAYCSLTLYLHDNISVSAFIKVIQKSYEKLKLPHSSQSTLWSIPVCYDKKVAHDLESFCHLKNISTNEFIALHSEPHYRIDFFGFLPGFPYLSGLHPQLHMPRRTQINQSIEAGTVAIGGQQTGIYPSQSPAGWHSIGQTPVRIFTAKNSPPCLMHIFDKIKFFPICFQEFLDIKELVTDHDYRIEKGSYRD